MTGVIYGRVGPSNLEIVRKNHMDRPLLDSDDPINSLP